VEVNAFVPIPHYALVLLVLTHLIRTHHAFNATLYALLAHPLLYALLVFRLHLYLIAYVLAHLLPSN
jgi:hypothetical protein